MKFHHIKIRLSVLMLVCLLSLMGMTGCASKAPQASLDPMLLDPMRLDQVKSVGVFDEQALAIRADDPLYFTIPMVEKGKHTTAFKLPVKKSKTPYLISYEIRMIDGPDNERFEKVGYWNPLASVLAYEEASKVDSLSLEESYTIHLIEKGN